MHVLEARYKKHPVQCLAYDRQSLLLQQMLTEYPGQSLAMYLPYWESADIISKTLEVIAATGRSVIGKIHRTD